MFSEAWCHAKGMMNISHMWPSCVSAGPSIWSSWGRDSSDHFRLQPRPASRRHPELCYSRWDPLHCHSRQIRSLLTASHLPSPENKLLVTIFAFSSLFFCYSRVSLSCRIVCETTSSGREKSGQASVKVRGGGLGLSAQIFSFQVSSSVFMCTASDIITNIFLPALHPSTFFFIFKLDGHPLLTWAAFINTGCMIMLVYYQYQLKKALQ